MNWERASIVAVAIVSIIIMIVVILAQIISGSKVDLRKKE